MLMLFLVLSLLHRGGPSVFACMGQGRSGAVALLRQGLLADLVLEVPLGSVHGLWAVYHRTEEEEGEDDEFGIASADPTETVPPLLLLESSDPHVAEKATATQEEQQATGFGDTVEKEKESGTGRLAVPVDGGSVDEKGTPLPVLVSGSLDPNPSTEAAEIRSTDGGVSSDIQATGTSDVVPAGGVVLVVSKGDEVVEGGRTDGSKGAGTEAGKNRREQHHAYILISQAGNCTKVLSQGEELSETTAG